MINVNVIDIDRHERGQARIIDTRDGTAERVVALGRSVRVAHREAFVRALAEFTARNEREGYPRFIADFIRHVEGA